MVNVDGVIYGNFRCDLAGFDVNRTWRNPLKEIHPQVQAIS
jgi:cytosolic carboxypeptidase protein 2/3